MRAKSYGTGERRDVVIEQEDSKLRFQQGTLQNEEAEPTLNVGVSHPRSKK